MRQFPVRSLISRLTLGFYMSPDYSWRVGADSEERVGAALEALPAGWVVRHDLMIGKRWNADHVIVGPPGAFVLDTKFRSAEVTVTTKGIRVGNSKTDMTEKLKNQAREISGRIREAGIKTWVQPVLVFDSRVKGKRASGGVHVVGIGKVVDYLTKLPRELDDIEVERLARILLDDTTWPHVRPSVAERAQEGRGSGGLRGSLREAVVVVLLGMSAVAAAIWLDGKRDSRSAIKQPGNRASTPALGTAAGPGERSAEVEAIRARYQAIGLSQRTLTKVTKEVSGTSSRSSILTGYFEHTTLRKAEWRLPGDGSEQLYEMTFFEGRLEFLFEKEVRESPDSERRYYLVDGRLIWATRGPERQPLSIADGAAAQQPILQLGAQVQQALQMQSDKLILEGGQLNAKHD